MCNSWTCFARYTRVFSDVSKASKPRAAFSSNSSTVDCTSFPPCLPLFPTLPLLTFENNHRPSDYPAPISLLQDNLFDILSSAAELANILSSKLLSARAEQHTKLELQEFVELFNESWAFVVRCEVICRRMIVGLRGVVVGQVRHTTHALTPNSS